MASLGPDRREAHRGAGLLVTIAGEPAAQVSDSLGLSHGTQRTLTAGAHGAVRASCSSSWSTAAIRALMLSRWHSMCPAPSGRPGHRGAGRAATRGGAPSVLIDAH